MEITRCVVWLQRIHLDLVDVNSQSIGDTSGEVIEDLLCRLPLADDEWIIKTVVETDLDKGRVCGLRWHTTWGLDNTGQSCWDASRSRAGGCRRVGV